MVPPDDDRMDDTADGMLNRWLAKYSIGEGLPGSAILFSNLLYPQYAYKFQTIPVDVWAIVQRRAAALLAEDTGTASVRAHWRDIIDGKVPFGMNIVTPDGVVKQARPLF